MHELESRTLTAYIEGRLGHAQRRRVEAHLEHCDRCLEAIATQTKVPGEDDPNVVMMRWALSATSPRCSGLDRDAQAAFRRGTTLLVLARWSSDTSHDWN